MFNKELESSWLCFWVRNYKIKQTCSFSILAKRHNPSSKYSIIQCPLLVTQKTYHVLLIIWGTQKFCQWSPLTKQDPPQFLPWHLKYCSYFLCNYGEINMVMSWIGGVITADKYWLLNGDYHLKIICCSISGGRGGWRRWKSKTDSVLQITMF